MALSKLSRPLSYSCAASIFALPLFLIISLSSSSSATFEKKLVSSWAIVVSRSTAPSLTSSSFFTSFGPPPKRLETSRVFSLRNSLSKMVYITSFSLGYKVWSYRTGQSPMI
jgi:hypothetical protein